MLNNYFEQFDNLPEQIRDAVSSDEKMLVLDDLGKKYGVNLSLLVIRVMVGDIKIDKLGEFLRAELKLDDYGSDQLRQELMDKIFAPVMDYLKQDELGTGENENGGVSFFEEDQGKDELNILENTQPVEIVEPGSKEMEKLRSGEIEKTNKGDNKSMEIVEQQGQFPISNFQFPDKLQITDYKLPIDADLNQVYLEFVKTALFQNAQEFAKSLLDKQLPQVKEEFYKAINAKESHKIIACLIVIAKRGVVRHSFVDDERYIGFMKKQIKENEEEFLKDPANHKYLIQFFKFILEKKAGLSQQDSPIVGTLLGSILSEVGESEYREIAYGDEERGVFVWDV